MFHWAPPTGEKKVFSYIHLMKNLELRDLYASSLGDEWTFRSFGAGMEDHISRTSELADKMRESAWSWHFKPGGDGYGYSAHQPMAVGRPALIYKYHYQGKLADALFLDGETCIDISQGSVEDNVIRLRQAMRPENHLRMCERARDRFREVVNFDEEEHNIRNFLQRLV
jgi:hypothetical protein